MKQYIHLVFTLGLLLTSVIIQFQIYNDDTMSKIDKSNIYSLVRKLGDLPGLSVFLKSTSNWPASTCLGLSGNISGSCLTDRQSFQDKVTQYLECDKHKSEYCTYILSILAGFAKYNSSTKLWMGKNVTETQVVLFDSVTQSGNFFHNSFVATEKSNSVLYRSVLFTLIEACIFGNVLVHILSQMQNSFPTYQDGPGPYIAVKIVFMFIPILLGLISAYKDKGAWFNDQGFGVLSIIIFPSLIILVWYEACLPHTEKSWCVF